MEHRCGAHSICHVTPICQNQQGVWVGVSGCGWMWVWVGVMGVGVCVRADVCFLGDAHVFHVCLLIHVLSIHAYTLPLIPTPHTPNTHTHHPQPHTPQTTQGRLAVDEYMRLMTPPPDQPTNPQNTPIPASQITMTTDEHPSGSQGPLEGCTVVPDVYALGDCCANVDKPLPPLAQVAEQQGVRVFGVCAHQCDGSPP